MITIYGSDGTAKTQVPCDDNSTQAKELQGDNVLTLSFTLYEHIALEVNDYAEFMGERYWLLPDDAEYDKLVDSAVADVKNRPGSCGAIAAGLFLKRFTEDKPWIHLDVAGTAWTSPPIWAYQTEGATGAGTATLYRLAETFFQQ